MVTEDIIESCERMMMLRRNVLRKALFCHGLHLGQPEMLLYVQQNPGCSQRQMAEDAGVTAASIAASFKRMESAGLIRRRADTADLRCNRVYITEKGEEELAYCLQDVQDLNQKMLCGLDTDELELMRRCMEKMVLNLLDSKK